MSILLGGSSWEGFSRKMFFHALPCGIKRVQGIQFGARDVRLTRACGERKSSPQEGLGFLLDIGALKLRRPSSGAVRISILEFPFYGNTASVQMKLNLCNRAICRDT